MHWHPIFAAVLRPMVEKYYAVETNMPVGDLPREADVVVLRRTGRRPPFRGLWRNLTPWNRQRASMPWLSCSLRSPVCGR